MRYRCKSKAPTTTVAWNRSSWYAPVGATLGNAWRVGYDVNNWGGVMNNALAVDKNLEQYAGPGTNPTS